jgi:hypothetical protein
MVTQPDFSNYQGAVTADRAERLQEHLPAQSSRERGADGAGFMNVRDERKHGRRFLDSPFSMSGMTADGFPIQIGFTGHASLKSRRWPRRRICCD